jgi:hypothetical protein
MNTPAFPAMHFDLADNEHGLTMRDYFAAKALQPVVDDFLSDGWTFANPELADVVAKNCYDIADAMLKAREA